MYNLKAHSVNWRSCQFWRQLLSPVKCRFFAWTLLHKKILTANNLNKRNWQNDPICKLCGIDRETPTHLCKDCPFANEVWSLIKQWFRLPIVDIVPMSGSIHGYWWKCCLKFDRGQRKKGGWNYDLFLVEHRERTNRRIFQQKSLHPRQVAMPCKDDIQQYQMATRPSPMDD